MVEVSGTVAIDTSEAARVGGRKGDRIASAAFLDNAAPDPWPRQDLVIAPGQPANLTGSPEPLRLARPVGWLIAKNRVA